MTVELSLTKSGAISDRGVYGFRIKSVVTKRSDLSSISVLKFKTIQILKDNSNLIGSKTGLEYHSFYEYDKSSTQDKIIENISIDEK